MVEGLVMESPYALTTRPRWLVARFPEPWSVLSWTLVNGGFQRLSGVSWLYLSAGELAAVESPREWMMAQMHAAGLAGTAGFLTSRREHAYVEAAAVEGDCRCWAVATVGLSNALRAGDPALPFQPYAGTINVLLCCSEPLSTEAALELLALASEAKAAAVLASGETSRLTGALASGTGTDCLAVAWPTRGDRALYAGKHTAIGAAGGRAVHTAVAEGIRQWRQEYPPKP